MFDIAEILWSFSILSILIYLFRALMAVQIPLSTPVSCPWVTQVMVQQLGGLHCTHDEQQQRLVSNVVSEERESLDQCNVRVEPIKLRRRPSKLLVPEFSPDRNKEFFVEKRRVDEHVEFAVQGRDYCLVSKKGRREHLEDRYNVVTDMSGDPNQAFFAVIDGHGGQEAANYVADNLGKNISKGLENLKAAEQQGVEEAISGAYFETDREFLNQGVGSGACTASVLLRNGGLYAANVGDCRVVMGRRGIATRLTNDHRLSREDERFRIENSGGFVHDYNGTWRVQGTLAVSRAIGDRNLKKWIISEPEIQHVHLSSDCEFLIVASDGLWDKVTEQEAVDVVSREEVAMESCKKLVDISCSRGSRDDITVILINLHNFVTAASHI